MKEKSAPTAEKFKRYLDERSTRRRAFILLALWLITAIPPITFFILDIIENALLAMLVASFPDLNPSLVNLASAITHPKLIAAILTYGILILSALIRGGRFIATRLSYEP